MAPRARRFCAGCCIGRCARKRPAGASRSSEGKRLVAAEDTGTGVLAAFEDGTDVRAAMSSVRMACTRRAGESSTLRHRHRATPGCSAWAGAPPLGRSHRRRDTFHMIFGKQAFFGYTVRPSGEVYWFANLVSTDIPAAQGRYQRSDPRCGRNVCGRCLPTMPARPPRSSTQPGRIWRRTRFSTCRRCRGGTPGRWSSPGTRHTPRRPAAARERRWRSKTLWCWPDVCATPAVSAKGLRSTSGYGGGGSSGWCATRRGSAAPKSPGPIGRWFRDLCMPAALRIFAGPKAHAWLYRHHIDWGERAGSASGSGPR